jgi:hypothetical protein
MAILAAALPIVSKVLDRVLPDQAAKQAAKLAMMELEQNGEFREDEIRMNAIVAEANSKDPFTSRARPGFFYVFYIYILAAIPMGFIAAWNPIVASDITAGIQAFLTALPSDLYNAFIVGFLGYGGMRTFEKIKGVSK